MQRAIARWAGGAALVFGLAALAAAPTHAQPDGGKVVGKVWEMTVRKADGKLKDNPPIEHVNGRVRVNGFDLFGLGGKKIGTFKVDKKEQMTVTFTDNKFKGYVVECSLTLREPPTWRGFGKKEGTDEKLHFQFVFLKD